MKLEQWSKEHRDVVRKMADCRDMPPDDFDVFWARCVQAELDPLLDQALPVSRNVNVGNKDKPVWTKRYAFQTTEAGMLARAERFPDFQGVQWASVFDGEPCVMRNQDGEVSHEFSPAQRKGKLAGAWARVLRKGRLPLLMWVAFESVKQDSPFWSKNPVGMLEKVARVTVLRRAYPETFGGVYIPEEMPADERDGQPTATQSPISGTRKVDAPAVAPATPGAASKPVEEAHAAEVGAICAEAAKLGPGTSPEKKAAYAALRDRAVKLPKGSVAKTRVAVALGEANKRMEQPAPAQSDAALADAELAADAFCADAEGLEKEDVEGYQRLRVRAEKMPEGAARARCMAALDAVKAKLEGVK